jgi:hypothetical protein
MRVGRPSKYYSGIGKELISHMAKGLSIQSFCMGKNIPYTTFYDWVHRHPKLRNDLEIGKCKTILFWEQIGLLAVMGKIKRFKVGMYLFQMRRLLKWYRESLFDDSNLNTKVS